MTQVQESSWQVSTGSQLIKIPRQRLCGDRNFLTAWKGRGKESNELPPRFQRIHRRAGTRDPGLLCLPDGISLRPATFSLVWPHGDHFHPTSSPSLSPPSPPPPPRLTGRVPSVPVAGWEGVTHPLTAQACNGVCLALELHFPLGNCNPAPQRSYGDSGWTIFISFARA